MSMAVEISKVMEVARALEEGGSGDGGGVATSVYMK
jgi:hypothetical protein